MSAGKLVLIVGGVRSGKSRFGQELATELGGDNVLFVATAEILDDEMKRRIQSHRQSRPIAWQTLERPLGVGDAIASTKMLPPVILVDCLTLLVSNVILQDDSDAQAAEARVYAELSAILNIVDEIQATLIIVSGEVGLGVVPETPLGRLFRDLLGWANQRLAARATATYWMISGMPINATLLTSTVKHAAQVLAGPVLKKEWL